MFISNNIGIIADDLTGADDTALQFHLRGANTQILLDYNILPENKSNTQVWAIPTETRNTDAPTAYEKVKQAARVLLENLNVEYFYKKMDSTLRGHVAVEALAMLDVLDWDAAVIIPAFPQEGRTTVGGYHLLKGIPIERTELARDPRFPIYESHIPTILRNELNNEQDDLVGLIELRTVIKGAGPILKRMNEMIEQGVKLIVVDAMSVTDIEQVVLAMEKSAHKILPCGSAGCAQVLGNIWLPESENHTIEKTIPEMPKLIVSGSATQITASQIQKLDDDDDIENTYFIALKMEDILEGVTDEIVTRVSENLVKDNVVVVHTSDLTVDSKIISQILFDNEMSKNQFISKIGDYLATLTKRVLFNRDAILIAVGGETSFKCCKAINSNSLQIIDAICPAIPLCLDMKAQWIVTKSGNLGNSNTLIDILKYFEHHE
ncbi:MAG: four-carbon acid sugar kinase family protein [Clostridium sp.]|nr:four-carbon acid sugar kinase family protein [Clostridium sp.]